MSETYIEQLLNEIATVLRKKYRHMNEICRLTEELADGLSRDDKVTATMVLEMRGKELEQVAECDKHIQLFLASARQEDAEKLSALLKGENDGTEFQNAENSWREVLDIVEKTKAIWRRTIEIDKVTSRRLAGGDSYYKQ